MIDFASWFSGPASTSETRPCLFSGSAPSFVCRVIVQGLLESPPHSGPVWVGTFGQAAAGLGVVVDDLLEQFGELFFQGNRQTNGRPVVFPVGEVSAGVRGGDVFRVAKEKVLSGQVPRSGSLSHRLSSIACYRSVGARVVPRSGGEGRAVRSMGLRHFFFRKGGGRDSFPSQRRGKNRFTRSAGKKLKQVRSTKSAIAGQRSWCRRHAVPPRAWMAHIDSQIRNISPALVRGIHSAARGGAARGRHAGGKGHPHQTRAGCRRQFLEENRSEAEPGARRPGAILNNLFQECFPWLQ